jgi:hypothetical protein
MRGRLIVALGGLLSLAQSRPPDIPFRIQMIDPGFSETAAFIDVNDDKKLDVVSGESWYEAPAWTRHRIRDINFNGQYIDNFADLPIDVDGDGYPDVVQFGYFSNNIVWMKNPGRNGGAWIATEIDSGFPTEFALLVDLDNDGKSRELLPEFDRANAPLNWYDVQGKAFVKHTVSDHSYGHGIGAGDVNGDGRNDILTPRGWFEAPADPRTGQWTFHETDWYQHPIAASGRGAGTTGTTGTAPPAAQFGFMYAIDINGDGRKDVLTGMAHDYGVCWFEQNADGTWTQRTIDNTWSQAHASALVDLNGDGQLDFITGKRYFAHNGSDPGEREPIGLYWYEFRRPGTPGTPGTTGTTGTTGTPGTAPRGGRGGAAPVVWTRHIIDYGGRMGGGMEIDVKDMDGDGDLDIVSGGKAGLFLAENLTKTLKRTSSGR